MTPIGSVHAGKTNRLNRLFARAAADGLALVSMQSPLRLDAYNEPEPDVMLLKPTEDDYQGRHPGAADVLLLVELSDSSLVQSTRRHGWQVRRLQDLPAQGTPVTLRVAPGAMALPKSRLRTADVQRSAYRCRPAICPEGPAGWPI